MSLEYLVCVVSVLFVQVGLYKGSGKSAVLPWLLRSKTNFATQSVASGLTASGVL